jgi:hypothetical protein
MLILIVAELDRKPNSGAAGTECRRWTRCSGAAIASTNLADGLSAPDQALESALRHRTATGYEAAIAAKYRECTPLHVHVNQAHCWLAAREQLRHAGRAF